MISIDYQDRRPIYEQIVARYQTLIVKGILTPDEQMPSVRQTALSLGINPNTISKAYGILEREGYIYSVKGRGSFVSGDQDVRKKKRQLYLERLEAVLTEGRELGVDAAAVAMCVSRVFGEKPETSSLNAGCGDGAHAFGEDRRKTSADAAPAVCPRGV